MVVFLLNLLSLLTSGWWVILLLPLVSVIANQDGKEPFFLPDHPYIAPPIDDDLGVSRQRSPCPGLNTLANHGYINRNGSAVTFRSVVEGAKAAFGVDPALMNKVILGILSLGPTTSTITESTEEEEQQVLVFDLFDWFTNNILESPGRLFRNDEYFEQFAQFNATIFDSLVDNYSDEYGMVTRQDIIDHRVERIRNSRRTNPEASFQSPKRRAFIMMGDVAVLLNMGEDPHLESVSVGSIRSFMEDNRITNDYLPRQFRNLSLLTDDEFAPVLLNGTAQLEAAMLATLDDHDDSSSWSHRTFVWLISVLSGLLAIGFLFLAYRSGLVSSTLIWSGMKGSGAQESVAPKATAGIALSSDSDTTSDDRCVSDARAPLGELASDSNSSVSSLDEDDAEPFQLSWESITVELPSKKKEGKRIISNMSGRAKSGELTCILGPSGSGKSTLLSVIGGRTKQRKFNVEGEVKVTGIKDVRWSSSSRITNPAWVGSADTLMELVTPQEAIRFSARLRLSRSVTDERINALVNEILSMLKLRQIKDRLVSSKSELSGGEKRLVSLGIELVTRPRVLLLDEITSGLDSHSAFNVVNICRRLAQKQQAAIVMIIHQPSPMAFSMMDHVLFLKSGRCLFRGETNGIEEYFSSRGLAVPKTYSIPDWVLYVSQTHTVKELEACGFFVEEETKESVGPLPENAVTDKKLGYIKRATLLTEVYELTKRQLLIIKRDPTVLGLRCAIIFAISLLVGVCFWGVGSEYLDDQGSFTSHVGVVFMLGFFCSLNYLMGVSDAVAHRRPFQHEYASGNYRMVSYAVVLIAFNFVMTLLYSCFYLIAIYWSIQLNGRFWYWLCLVLVYSLISSALADLVVAIPEVPEIAFSAAPMIITPQLLFSGFLVGTDSLPVWVRWMSWTQPLTYMFRLLLNEELSECQDLASRDAAILSCSTAFERAYVDALENSFHNSSLYDENSLLTLLQGGQYKGKEQILEYFAFLSEVQAPLSLIWDFCPVKGSQLLLVNEVADGLCDVTLSAVFEARINEHFNKNQNPLVNLVLGRKLVFEHADDLSSATIKNESVFLPPAFFDHVYNNSNSVTMSSSICQILEETCPDVYLQNGFDDMIDCIEKMDALPLTATNNAGINTVRSNSTGCRNLHASMAVVSPQVHCPHLSYTPMEDLNGKMKCHKNIEHSFDAYFSRNDFVLFQRTAQMSGMDPDTYFKPSVSKSTCVAEGVIEPETIQAARVLPDDFYCFSYLESQEARDEDGLIPIYWSAMFGFLLLFRLVGLCVLHRRV